MAKFRWCQLRQALTFVKGKLMIFCTIASAPELSCQNPGGSVWGVRTYQPGPGGKYQKIAMFKESYLGSKAHRNLDFLAVRFFREGNHTFLKNSRLLNPKSWFGGWLTDDLPFQKR